MACTRLTSLAAIKDLRWLCTSWLAPSLPQHEQDELEHALTLAPCQRNELFPYGIDRALYFGESSLTRARVYCVFPHLQRDLRDDDVTLQCWHDQVVLPAFRQAWQQTGFEGRKGCPQAPPSFFDLKCASEELGRRRLPPKPIAQHFDFGSPMLADDIAPSSTIGSAPATAPPSEAPEESASPSASASASETGDDDDQAPNAPADPRSTHLAPPTPEPAIYAEMYAEWPSEFMGALFCPWYETLDLAWLAMCDRVENSAELCELRDMYLVAVLPEFAPREHRREGKGDREGRLVARSADEVFAKACRHWDAGLDARWVDKSRFHVRFGTVARVENGESEEEEDERWR